MTRLIPQPKVQEYLNFKGSDVGNETHWPEMVKSDSYAVWAMDDN
jgi:hypothetical protein